MREHKISEREPLLQLISRKQLNSGAKIKLDLEPLSPEENAFYTRKLNEWSEACGCELAALLSFVAIIGIALHAIFMANAIGWFLIVRGLVILLLAAATGKVIGIVVAKVRLRRMVLRIVDSL